MTYESWRITFQSSESAARSAYKEVEALRAQVASLQSLVARKDEGLIKAIEIIDSEGVYTNAVTKLQTLLALKASDVKAPEDDDNCPKCGGSFAETGGKPINIPKTDKRYYCQQCCMNAYEQGKV